MIQRKIFSAPDAAPYVLHAKQVANDEVAFPILATSSGCLLISEGLDIPSYDSIILSYSSGLISKVYYLVGGTAGVVIATLSLNYSGSNIISVVRT